MKAVEQFGRVDVILNNAGIMPLSTMDSLHVDEWDKMIDVNIKGVLNGIAAVLPYMKEQKSGQIINTSSVAGHKVFNGSAVYSATKYAVRALTEGLRMEVKPIISVQQSFVPVLLKQNCWNISQMQMFARRMKIMWEQ
jgi:NADP-dependent 3-hydroxy acid dehydrogenase YdfG